MFIATGTVKKYLRVNEMGEHFVYGHVFVFDACYNGTAISAKLEETRTLNYLLQSDLSFFFVSKNKKGLR